MKNISNRYVQSYTYNKLEENVGREYIESRLKYIRLYIKQKMKVLELGCGDGLLGEQIIRRFDCNMHGLDISPSGVLLAKRRGIVAKIADLNEDLPYADNSFDMIYSDQMLEHVYRTDYLLDEIYRVLKPGGIVITITPNLSFWVNRILFPFEFFYLLGFISSIKRGGLLKSLIVSFGIMLTHMIYGINFFRGMMLENVERKVN